MTVIEQSVKPVVVPPLDPHFVPSALWNLAYRGLVSARPDQQPLHIALSRSDGHAFVHETRILPHGRSDATLNSHYVERLLKFLRWQKGGSDVRIAGCDPLAETIAGIYSTNGERAFDVELVGRKIFKTSLTVNACSTDDLPAPHDPALSLGGHLDGCRIGFDLGGSDRKCAALIDGEVIFSHEVTWDPYFEPNPRYHRDGIHDTISRAAAALPRVDAIGGSAAGVYLNNEVRTGSLFRGETDESRRH